MQIVQEMTASQTHEYIVLFVALFFTFLQSNLSCYFQSDYSTNEPLSIGWSRMKYKICQIIAIPQIHSIFYFRKLCYFLLGSHTIKQPTPYMLTYECYLEWSSFDELLRLYGH